MIIVIPKNSYQYFSVCLLIKRFNKNICMIASIIYVKKIRNSNSLSTTFTYDISPFKKTIMIITLFFLFVYK